MRYILICLALLLAAPVSADVRFECVKEFWGVCVLEIRRESQAEKDELLRRWWECVKLGLPGDTDHQDRCEHIVYGTEMAPSLHELRR